MRASWSAGVIWFPAPTGNPRARARSKSTQTTRPSGRWVAASEMNDEAGRTSVSASSLARPSGKSARRESGPARSYPSCRI